MLLRVLAYHVESGKQIKVLLVQHDDVGGQTNQQQQLQYVVMTSRRVYDEKTISFRQFFPGHAIPKKFIDVVTILDDSRGHELPIAVVKEGTIDVATFEEKGYQIKDLESSFFKEFTEITDVIPTFDTRNQANESLFTCSEKMTESQFVLRYLHHRNHHFLKTCIAKRFLAVYNKMRGSWVPTREEYFHLYFDDGDPFLRLPATMAIREIIQKKVFKHVAEKLCPYLTVSLSKEEHLRAMGLNICLALPRLPKLEFFNASRTSPYACYTHVLDVDGTRKRASGTATTTMGKCSEKLVLICRTPEAFAVGQLKYKHHKKKKVLRHVPLDRPLINVPLVVVTDSKEDYFLCYDPTRGRVVCHGSNLQDLMSTHIKGMNVVFYGSDREYASQVLYKYNKRRVISRTMGPKPPGFDIMHRACSMYGREPVVNDTSNATWYKKGSVVCETSKNMHYEEGATSFDFSNYYATVLKLNASSIGDEGLARTVDLMSELRRQGVSSVKPDIVSLLGLAKHYDERTYNLIKMEGVTNCLATILANSTKKKIVSVTTDGITFRGRWKRLAKLPDPRYTIKREYCFKGSTCFFATSNQYFGRDKGKKFIVKGLAGRNNFPVVKQFVETLVRLVSTKYSSKKKVTDALIVKRLKRYLTPSEDYLLPTSSSSNQLRYPAEYAYSELCQDRHLCLASSIHEKPNSHLIMDSVHKKRNSDIVKMFFKNRLIHINSILAMDTEGYIKLFEQKLESCGKMFGKAYPHRRRRIAALIDKLVKTVRSHLLHNMGSAQEGAVVPGALFPLH